jgi:methyl-accepting chemotaxis protein
VRSLSGRSAAAAKEIKGLITDSVANVTLGTELVDKAGMTMSEIVTSVNQVKAIMADITTAGHEQSNGIEQINQAITQMDNTTQQNAALVEEAAAAAGSLQVQAANLADAVGVFKLGASSVLAAARSGHSGSGHSGGRSANGSPPRLKLLR